MKKSLLIAIVISISFKLSAQSVIDSCFSSVSTGTGFTSSALLANTTDADLLNWTGSQWTGQWPNCSLTVPPPCPGGNQTGIFMGDQTVWTSGGEGAGFLLSSPLVAGQTYTFSFTYISDGFGANGAFAPSISTNSIPDFASATQVGFLPPAAFTWLTSVYTFTATAGQAGHDWLIVHSNDGSGILLNNCSAALGAVLDLGTDSTLCIGDSMLINAGPNFSIYNWNTGDTTQAITVTTSGTYIVFVLNSCGFGVDSINVNFVQCNFNVSAALASSDTSFCEKQCIDFTDLSTNTPTSWQWFFQGGTPDTSTAQNPTGICYNSYGSFEVKLIACNALSCDTITLTNFINEYQNPSDSIWGSNDTLYSLPFPSYQWYEVTGGLLAGETNQYFVPTVLGSYYCVVSDTIGCVATSNTITLTGLATSSFSGGDGSIVIVPNPNNGSFAIVLNKIPTNGGLSDISILNTLGQIVFESQLGNGNAQIIKTNLKNGIYFLQLNSGNKTSIQKFVVLNK